jgi:UDPglucose 6-dehydrogenase
MRMGHGAGSRRGPGRSPGRARTAGGTRSGWAATSRDPANGNGRCVAVIGAGYVGLPTAATLARLGHNVTCGDANPDRVAMLQRGEMPIVEDQLDELVAEGVAAGHLRFVVGATAAVTGAEFIFLCVPTPQGEDGSADLSFVEAVAREIGPHLLPGAVIVNKSTVPVGSTLVVERVLGRPDVIVVSNPEFLREGTAVADSLQPERIVVGADDQAAAARVGELFAGTQAPLLITDAATAETIKYASNAFLATKLSFVNAVAGLCEAVGADVRDVILGLGYDKRIGFEYLRPGPGWGGSCLPKDTRALVHIAEQAGYDFSFLKGAIATNDEQFTRVVGKVRDGVSGASPGFRRGVFRGGSRDEALDDATAVLADVLDGTVIAVWGLTFKAGTDDLRNSPAVEVARRLVDAGALVQAFDPTIAVPDGHASATVVPLSEIAGWDDGAVDRLRAFPDAYTACAGAAVLVVLTEWDQFRWLDFAKVGDVMVAPVVVDARNLLDPAQLRRLGFTYSGIGRP